MHGPGSYSGGAYKTPSWPYSPIIDVLDTIALSLGEDRRAQWRRCRDRSLDAWAQADLTFLILEDVAEDYPAIDPTDTSDAALGLVVVQPYLRLMKMPVLFGGKHKAIAWWTPLTDPGAFAAYKMGAAFWGASGTWRRYVVTHEIGHCLGLNHRLEAGAESVMADGNEPDPDAHDITSLADYYEEV